MLRGENYWNFWRKLTEIWWKIQANQQLTNHFHQAAQTKKHARKILRVWTRKDRFFEKKFQKILWFFDQNLYVKLTFFVNFHEISLIMSAPAPKVLPLEDNTRLLQQLFRFRGGGTFPVFPLPTPLTLLISVDQKINKIQISFRMS